MTVDPNTSPYATPPTEGLPYRKGSDEDQAIRRILARAGSKPERRFGWLRRWWR